MADDAKKPGADEGVMANLPATRPSRLSRRGRAEGDGDAAKSATAAAAKPKKAGAKPAAAKPKATAAKKAKPAAAKSPGAAKKAPTKPKLEAVPSPDAPAKPRKPRPVRAATPTLREPAATANENREPAEQKPSGKDLATTVVQAAGELAQIGLTVGGQLLKRAADKLPKP
jgi:hypothetical protein